METFERYAVYYAPEPGPLASFAAGWLGWDPASGTCPEPVAVEGLPRPRAALTEEPRRYGFHGTLKPPFRLAAGSSRAALEDDLAGLATGLAAAGADGLALTRIGGFLALTPDGDSRAIARVAAEVVAGLDRHRAPAPPEEIARRRATGLSPRQEAHLAHWGYPYVMDEFRFHLTLTGKLAPDEAGAVEAALAPHLAPLLPRPFRLADLCLFGEDAERRFHLIARFPLTG
ncbi:DUF1045 domain-containing protein [Sinisalibacter aestuarii]|uniref:Phosphonate metabolism protein n=1 Tax=Sinisalibacter aestuarii TaxID=2949426 RepID=A0ABQ5LX94_9RHOB|nr:DUF1045 domain-containing protein [Sinisalibacter aestuarii]GKY89544.1 phosphonate metabolism protein [Sinisalibacter aestuarii]